MSLVAQVVSHYQPSFPRKLTELCRQAKYDPDLFFELFVSFQDLKELKSKSLSGIAAKGIAVGAYYVYYLHIIASAIVMLINPLIGVISLLFLPLIVSSAVYVILLIVRLIKNPSFSNLTGIRLSKNTKNDPKGS